MCSQFTVLGGFTRNTSRWRIALSSNIKEDFLHSQQVSEYSQGVWSKFLGGEGWWMGRGVAVKDA